MLINHGLNVNICITIMKLIRLHFGLRCIQNRSLAHQFFQVVLVISVWMPLERFSGHAQLVGDLKKDAGHVGKTTNGSKFRRLHSLKGPVSPVNVDWALCQLQWPELSGCEFWRSSLHIYSCPYPDVCLIA